MRAILLALVLTTALAACCRDRPELKPDLPDPGGAVMPELVEVERIVYVRIPAALLKQEPIAEGPIAQCFSVAAERRAALERCNARLQHVGAIQGTEVKP